MSAAILIDPCLKTTWIQYIDIILNEAEVSLNPTIAISLAALKIRPHLSFIFPFYSQQIPTSIAGKINYYFFQTKSKKIQESLEQSNYYKATALLLQSYHTPLITTLGLDQKNHFSSKIIDIITQIQEIDSTRSAEIKNIFYARCFLVLGLSALLATIGNIFTENHWISTAWLVTVAKISCMTSLLIYAVNWLYHHGDSRGFNEKYKEIRQIINELRTDLKSYNDNMQLTGDGLPPIEYVKTWLQQGQQ